VLQLPYIDGFSYSSHIVKAYHPSGVVTAALTNQYANQALDTWTNSYDAFGNYTFHKLKKNGGTVVHGHTLIWDAAGRLIKVVNRDDVNDGFDWTAIYDGLGRRLRTVYTPIIGGVSRTNVTLTLDSWYDPQTTYLETGVAVNNQRTWKIYGPDISQGSAMQGLGGLEATIREYDGYSIGIINDYFGNGVAMITNAVTAFGGRVTSYGPIPLQDLPLLSPYASLAESTVWRGKRIDPSGFYYMGARYYDPNAGRFISPDPLGHAASIDLYSAFGGDGVNNFDPDGRCMETAIGLAVGTVQGVANGIGQGGAIGYDMVAQTTWSLGGSGGEYRGVSDLYNNIYDNPNSGPDSHQILGGTLRTEANIATLGLYGMAQGFYNGATTGDYSQAQTASVNALLLAPGAAQYSRAFNGYMNASLDAALPSEFNIAGSQNIGGSIYDPSTVSVTSPNAAMRAAVQGSYINPLTNERITTSQSLAADHIVAQDTIKDMLGFNGLTPSEASQVLNNPINFQGLPKSFNSSKGGKNPGDWTTYKGQPLDPNYIQRNQQLQNILQPALEQQILNFINGNN
jgi:RHS repeat-associated protein